MTSTLWIGIHRHGAGWRATVTQGRDRPRVQRHFPQGTDPRVMQAWRRDTKAKLHVTRKQRATMGTFAYDAKRYLASVTALTTYADRQRDIQHWIDLFGTKDRSLITSAEIRAQRDRWLTTPRDGKNAPPVAAGTVNKRLRALSNLFRVLDGPHVPNPVRDVPEVPEPAPEPKALDYGTIAKILAKLPDVGKADKGHTRPKVSKSKIRLTCLAYCPITPKELGALTPADLDLERGLIRLPARQKGRGTKGIWLPLLPQAIAAFETFHAEHCYGRFSRSSLRKSFQKAAKRVTKEKVWPYRLRHAFGTAAYRATRSLDETGKLMRHTEKSTTLRYALEAEADVLNAIVQTLGRPIGTTGLTNFADHSAIVSTTEPQEKPQQARTRVSRKRASATDSTA